MTHDRVMRFVPVFETHDQATRFATEQALVRIGGRLAPAARPATSLQA